jgi:hypothetical protein
LPAFTLARAGAFNRVLQGYALRKPQHSGLIFSQSNRPENSLHEKLTVLDISPVATTEAASKGQQ